MPLLENHYRDMCDIEFTIEQGRLFILQTRVGKRTAAAALRMAVEMEGEGLIDKREAVLRVQPGSSTSCCTRSSTRRRRTTCSPRASTRRRAPRSARCTSPPTTPRPPRPGRARDPRAPRDLARRPARHDRGRGHPHVARWARSPRGRGRARHGHAGDLRRRRARRSTSQRAAVRASAAPSVREGDVISINGRTGEVVRRRGPGGDARADRAVRHHARLGRRVPHDEGPHQRRPARGRAQGPRVRRRGHRSVPDRAHVPRRPAADRAAHDPRGRRSRGGRGARGARARSSRPTSSASSRRWTACRSPCGCSTRRCTSSCPTTRSWSPSEAHGRARRRRGRTLLHARASAGRRRTRCSAPAACRLGILKPGLYRMQVRALMRGRGRTRKRAGGDPQVEIMIPLIVTRARDGAARRLGARGGREGLRGGAASASTTSSAR